MFDVCSEGIGEGVEREDCVQALSGQIFMGMVSSQFQARLDTVRLIDALVAACIRFVYFSMEDELRSKVCVCVCVSQIKQNSYFEIVNRDFFRSRLPIPLGCIGLVQ